MNKRIKRCQDKHAIVQCMQCKNAIVEGPWMQRVSSLMEIMKNRVPQTVHDILLPYRSHFSSIPVNFLGIFD